MWQRRIANGFGALFALVALAAAAHAEISKADFDLFVEESSSRYTDPGDSIDFEDVFYAAAKAAGSPDQAVSLLARSLKLSAETAERYAGLIVVAVRHRATCGKTGSCDISDNQALTALIKAAGFEDASGQVLLAVGKNIEDDVNRGTFLKLVRDHPAVPVICMALFDYTHDFEFVVPLFSKRSIDSDVIVPLFAKTDHAMPANSMALIDLAGRRAGNSRAKYLARLRLARLQIETQLRFALTGDAVSAYLQLSPHDRANLWRVLANPKPIWVSDSLVSAYAELKAKDPEKNGAKADMSKSLAAYQRRELQEKLDAANRQAIVNLAAALLLEHHTNDAERLLKRLPSDDEAMNTDYGQLVSFIREVMNPSLNEDDLYDLMIQGYKTGAKKPEKDSNDRFSGIDGWLGALNVSISAFGELGYRYLSARGYPQMARYLVSGNMSDEGRRAQTGIYDAFTDELGRGFPRRVADYKKRLANANSARKALARTALKSVTPTPVHVGERPVYFRELPLPQGVAPFRAPESGVEENGEKETKQATGDAPPKDLQLPVSPYQVVRLEKIGSEWALIFLSQALDPVGEVSPGGYWITRSRARGHGWEPPIYLGLQQFFPYVIVPRSNLPIIDGDVLQIEVLVRELDKESITFPPIGLRAKRRKDGVYLRFAWEDLTRDKDQDGLTDIVEHRMGLNPDNPDTDGDGLHDGSDSLPLTPFRLRPPEENELAIAILGRILGYERQAIIVGNVEPPPKGQSLEDILKSARGPRPVIDAMHTTFMRADPGVFSGIRLPTRLLVYGPDAVDAMAKQSKQYGVFYPVGVQWIFSSKDGTRHFVSWSASWTGGAFILRKGKDGFEVEVVSSWIT